MDSERPRRGERGRWLLVVALVTTSVHDRRNPEWLGPPKDRVPGVRNARVRRNAFPDGPHRMYILRTPEI